MSNELILKKATLEDLEAILHIYKHAIETMESNGIYQWDNVYPNKEVIINDILESNMFLGEVRGQIASVFVLNQDYESEYENGKWQYEEVTFYRTKDV